MAYRCEAQNLEAFIQQLAVSYVARGYWFYVTGWIPERKDHRAVDAKLIAKYQLDISKQARARRKARGLANMHYLRHGRFFVLLASMGAHEFRIYEADSIRDIRRQPIVHENYSVGFRNGHASVRIAREEYRRLRAYFEEVATSRRGETLAAELNALPFAGYAPVRRQVLNLRALVNRRRREAGYETIPVEALLLSRRNVRVFSELPLVNAA
jgi:hypothetical protein